MIADANLLLDGSINSAGVLTGTSVNSGTTFTTGANTDSANIIRCKPDTLFGHRNGQRRGY